MNDASNMHSEFSLIKNYFQRKSKHFSELGQVRQMPQARSDVVLGIGDDAAIIQIPEGYHMVCSIDTSVSGVHFIPDTPASAIGHKALAVSLSDLAAMGATPAWVLMSLSMPVVDKKWLAAFCDGFFALADAYCVQLIGGDLTRGQLAITTHAIGYLPQGQGLFRHAAKVGDTIALTGSLGGAGLALQALRGQISLSQEKLWNLQQCLYRPQPRVVAGFTLLNQAHGAIDLSDGLLSDLQHILTASQVGADIYLDKIPIHPILRAESAMPWEIALSSGDDYELCFTLTPQNWQQINEQLAECGIACYAIGEITEAVEQLRVYERAGGRIWEFKKQGYKHF